MIAIASERQCWKTYISTADAERESEKPYLPSPVAFYSFLVRAAASSVLTIPLCLVHECPTLFLIFVLFGLCILLLLTSVKNSNHECRGRARRKLQLLPDNDLLPQRDSKHHSK